MKGSFWLCLGGLTVLTIAVLAYKYGTKENIWCDERLKAGHCEHYPSDKSCYCVDENTDELQVKETGIYEHSSLQCAQLNGTLATPDTSDLLIWLSKRMFHMGVDEAYVGLERRDSAWFWTKTNGSQQATDIKWREDIYQINNQTNAVISVETVKIEDEQIENGFIYYNYDYHVEHNPKYIWYGFKTASNIYDSSTLLNIYYICHYPFQPPKSLIKQEASTSAPEIQTDNINNEIDDCFCSSNERVKLLNLDDSQTFTSPRYPMNYCSDNNCRWTITTKDDLVIKLEWIVFSTENGFDMVYIHDGERGDDPLVDKCTGTQCADQQSSSNKMHIHFTSDHVTTNIGFKGIVTAVEDDKCHCSKSLQINFANLGDSFAFQTPSYPNPYCVNLFCSWTMSSPEGYGLRIVWNKFGLGNSDFVFVHDGGSDQDQLLRNCTSTHCGAIVSSGESIHVAFQSDEHNSSHTGFAAVVTSVQNYCKKESLFIPLGSVTYTNEREDGFIAVRGRVTLTCSGNSKIYDTIDTMTTVATCTDMGWSSLPVCVTVCPLPNTAPSPTYQTVHVCKVQHATDKEVVAKGHRITLIEQDKATKQQISITVYTCSDGSNWLPETPTCHSSLGVMLIGGRVDWDVPPEVFSPYENSTHNLEIANLEYQKQHVSLMLQDGRILVAGGYSYLVTRGGYFIQRSTYYIDLNTLTAQPGPVMISGRLSAAAAVFNKTPVICGGHTENSYLSDCEILEDGQWKQATKMPIARAYFALVAIGKCLYAIGGKHRETTILQSGHKLCPEESEDWKSIASMSEKRELFAAAVLNDNIYICGGFAYQRSCEYYSSIENVWRPIAQMNEIRYRFSMAAVHGRLFALGTEEQKDLAGQVTNKPLSIEFYDEVVGKWQMSDAVLRSVRALSSMTVVPLMDWEEQ